MQVARISAVADQLVNHSGPMNEAALRILDGVNYSVASLRGWVFRPATVGGAR